jgi:hypothetical protein
MPRFSTTGRATSLQHVLKNVLECDLTLPLYLSVLQHFGAMKTNSTLLITFYAIKHTLRTLATLRQLLRPQQEGSCQGGYQVGKIPCA